MFEGKKITKATFKSFVNKNRANLYVRTDSSFDGMTDCVESVNGSFALAQADTRHTSRNSWVEERTLGINGIWLVGQSRDYFEPYNRNGFAGISVHNSCGSFVVAVKV